MSFKTVVFTTALSTVRTSEINVQAGQRINVGIWIGSVISGPTLSAASATVVLERRLNYLSGASAPIENSDAQFWRVVNTWTVQAANGLDDNVEVITTSPEPENCQYRLGVTVVDVGTGQLRIGNGIA